MTRQRQHWWRRVMMQMWKGKESATGRYITRFINGIRRRKLNSMQNTFKIGTKRPSSNYSTYSKLNLKRKI